MKNAFVSAALVAAALATGQVWGATTWVMNTTTVTGGGVSMNSQGWANTGTGATIDTQALEAQTLTLYGGNGLGIANNDGCASGTTCDVGDLVANAPEHAVDNEQRREMILLTFTGGAVKLNGLRIGWGGADTDMTVLAWTGVGAPPTLAGLTWGTLSAGWSVIGNYGNVAVNTNTDTAINAGNVSSSYWLIGAYNYLSGSNTASTNGQSISAGDDYMKLYSVSGDVTPPNNRVPEPGSLALTGLALLGAAAVRRRARKA